MKRKLQQLKKNIITADNIMYALIISLLAIFSPDLVLMGVYAFLYPYFWFTRRTHVFPHLYISSAIALCWMLIAKEQYGYNQEMLVIVEINIFALCAWALGLFAIYLIYSYWADRLKYKELRKKTLLFVVIYWVLILSAETIAYHVFNFRNISTEIYAGLPVCDCIHAPGWMQASYLILGLIYFAICELIGLKNPYQIKKK
ncbi:hypothetical protein KKG22_01420 [Patescibacteria group bacterium]|nr:hypothetical protein [Patescibacteria group bacterium]MBU1721754.1 hypothetical protein [Patescibacteria group bacterium]MBU1901407.1 hypothetical protein [Patescibacteria group bacterium]